MLDQEKVRELAQTSDTTKTIFNALANRERFRGSTDLAKFHRHLLSEGAKVVPNEFMELFKRLHDMKVGTLVLGRKGKPNRFIWNYNFKDIGKLATNSVDVKQVKPLPTPKPTEENLPEALLGAQTVTLKLEASPELVELLKKIVGQL